MTLKCVGQPLEAAEQPDPVPGPGEVLLAVQACAVCRTDLHVVDGELPDVPTPIIPGHEIVGRVLRCGPGVSLPVGMRLGVPWLGWTCGTCTFCRSGQENLCDAARFTGYQRDGGYADRVLADARYCFPLPDAYSDAEAAPLLCAGLIGYRSLRLAGLGRRLGLYGFGAAAHIVIQLARHENRDVYAFTRPGDAPAQAFARSLGAVWAGGSDEVPPHPLDAAILFAPVGELVPRALAAVRKGGTVVCGGIHMSDIPRFPYALLWGERVLRSVANLTRTDAQEFLALAPQVPIRTEIRRFALDEANAALAALRRGDLTGAAVLIPPSTGRDPDVCRQGMLTML
ncbi:MAG TPA: zinc-dependent alcohol dehydrogenase family protein [Candidatus Macondimonas sp.]|nr:zinc-dependent alcohol dehydrogenase family protein [Candidatus Macondimonas sp.]